MRSSAGRFPAVGACAMSKQFSKPFYNSAAWQNTRDAYVAERMSVDGGLCEECREAAGEELHHIVPLTPANIGDYAVTLDPENLKWLCKDCHFKAHREMIAERCERMRGGGKILRDGCYIDENGFLQKQKVFVVWGAPASGKSTYVAAHKQAGDLVVDLDLLKAALYGKTERCEACGDNLLPLAVSIRDFILVQVRRGAVDCKNVWVIASLPKRSERNALRESLNAELVYIESNYHECIRRAGLDSSRRDRDFQRYIIDKWFEAVEW